MHKLVQHSAFSFCLNQGPLRRVDDKASQPQLLGKEIGEGPEADALHRSPDSDSTPFNQGGLPQLLPEEAAQQSEQLRRQP